MLLPFLRVKALTRFVSEGVMLFDSVNVKLAFISYCVYPTVYIYIIIHSVYI